MLLQRLGLSKFTVLTAVQIQDIQDSLPYAVRLSPGVMGTGGKIAALCIRFQDGLWFNRFKLSVVEPVSTSKSVNYFQQAIGAFCQHFVTCWGWLEQMV